MAGGKYGAIAGMIGRMQMMENISEQLASIKVHGYKKGTPTFQAQLAEARSGMATKGVNYVRVSGETIDFTPGQLEFTDDPLHLAINGDGFFQVQRDDGSFGYTRKGLFKLDADGVLVDTNGRQVMGADGGPLSFPSPDVDIAPDGSIWQSSADSGQPTQVGQIAVYQFEDNAILRRAQGSMFVPADDTRPDLHPEAQLVQRNLETSNVDMLQTMGRMTANLRAFEATQKVLKIYSEMGKGADLGLVQ